MATKIKKKTEQYKTAVTTAKNKSHSAIQRAETQLFEQSDRLARRSQDQASSRSGRGLGVG